MIIKLILLILIVAIVYSHKCNHDEIQKNIKVGFVNEVWNEKDLTNNCLLNFESY